MAGLFVVANASFSTSKTKAQTRKRGESFPRANSDSTLNRSPLWYHYYRNLFFDFHTYFDYTIFSWDLRRSQISNMEFMQSTFRKCPTKQARATPGLRPATAVAEYCDVTVSQTGRFNYGNSFIPLLFLGIWQTLHYDFSRKSRDTGSSLLLADILSFNILFSIFICLCVSYKTHMWRSEDTLKESVMSFCHVDSQAEFRPSCLGISPFPNWAIFLTSTILSPAFGERVSWIPDLIQT